MTLNQIDKLKQDSKKNYSYVNLVTHLKDEHVQEVKQSCNTTQNNEQFSRKSSIHSLFFFFFFFFMFWTCILTLIFITFSHSFLFRFFNSFSIVFFSNIYFIQLKFQLKTQSIQAITELRRQCARTDSNQNFNLEIKSSDYVT